MTNHTLSAIVPCNDLDESRAFYSKLGFKRSNEDQEYRILSDGCGAEFHLNPALDGWPAPRRNPFGLYLYSEGVDKLASLLGKHPEDTPWGMYEFAVSDLMRRSFARVG